MHLTKELRQYDAGALFIGTRYSSYNLQIPSNQESIKFDNVCHPECTKMLLPPNGITLISSILHAHLVGKAITESLVRDGVEIQKLFHNPNYNFNYQLTMGIEPVKVFPV